MKITISASALIQAISIIDLIPARAGITSSEFIQLEKKKNKLYFSLASEVYGTIYAKAVTFEDGDWKFHIDRTSLVPFILAAVNFTSPADFIISLEEKKKAKVLVIKSGRRKVIFNEISFIAGYPGYEDIKIGKAIPLDSRQRRLLQLASRYATSDPTLSYINCVKLKRDVGVMASNRITLFYAENKTLPISVPLPLLVLKLVDNENVNSIEVDKNVIKLLFRQGFICQAINDVAVKDFPDKQLIKQFNSGNKYTSQFSIRSTTFLKAIDRLETYIRGVVARELLVSLKIDKNTTKLLLYCDTPQGRFSETVKTIVKAKSDINCEWLLTSLTPLVEFMKNLGKLEIKFDKDTPFLIQSEDKISVVIAKRI